jgi:hypothetical protein
MKNNINLLSSFVISLIFLNGCGDKDIKAKELGFINSREMRVLQAEGFNTKDEYARHSGFSGLEEMRDAEALYIGTSKKYYEYLKQQEEIKVTRQENMQLDVLLSELDQINKIKRLMGKSEFTNNLDIKVMIERLNELNNNVEKKYSGMKFSDMQCTVDNLINEKIICTIDGVNPKIKVKITPSNFNGLSSSIVGANIMLSGKITNIQMSSPMTIYAKSTKFSKR